MSITVTQAYDLGTLTSQGGAIMYIVTSPTAVTQAQVRTAVQAVVPGNSAMLSTYGYVMPLDDLKITHLTDTLWTAEAVYKRPQPRNMEPESENGPVIDFDTSGGSQHITMSQDATLYLRSGIATPPTAALKVIGYDGKRVHGVDIGFGVYRFSEEWTLPDSASSNSVPTKCDSAYRAILKDLTFKTNSGTFRGFAAGEVLFEGATGRRIKGGAFSVTYKFAVSPNAASLTVGGITGISKKGWQYLDVKMDDSGTTDGIYQVPSEVRVHDVYESGSFSTLKIGTDAI
jgi:hypothetical protein